jgi:hypothetical protein
MWNSTWTSEMGIVKGPPCAYACVAVRWGLDVCMTGDDYRTCLRGEGRTGPLNYEEDNFIITTY